MTALMTDAEWLAWVEEHALDPESPHHVEAFREYGAIQRLDEQGFEREVAAEEHRLMAKQEAERRIAARNYTGGRVLTWEQMEDERQEWLCDGLVPVGGLVEVLGRTNGGKTFAVVGLALSMIAGLDFLGRATKPGRVFFILGEGRRGFLGRIKAWCAEHGVSPDDIRPHVGFYDGGNLNNDASLADLRQVLGEFAPDLVVFDTYATLSGVSDEDKSALANETMRRAREVAPAAALLFTHHPSKATEDSQVPVGRGSGAVAAHADVILTLTRDRKYTPKDGEEHEYLRLSTAHEFGGKTRESEAITLDGLYLKTVNGSKVMVQHELGGQSRNAAMIAEHFAVGEVFTAFDVEERTGKSLSTAKRMVRAENVTVVAQGIGTTPTRYVRES